MGKPCTFQTIVYNNYVSGETNGYSGCVDCGGIVAQDWQSGCLQTPTGCVCEATPTMPAEACPYTFKNLDSSKSIISDNEAILKVRTRVQWNPIEKYKYYKVIVQQNNKQKIDIIETVNINECKQFVDIFVFPAVPAFISIIGYHYIPTIESQNISVFKTKYTVTIAENNYVYENISTVRRKDKENESTIVYETNLIEGVCSII